MVEGLVVFGVIGLTITAVAWSALRNDAQSEPEATPATSVLLPIGWLMVVVGLIGSVGAANIDISPYGELANIDAVGQRTMLFEAGVAVFLAGVVLAACGLVLNAIRAIGIGENCPSSEDQA